MTESDNEPDKDDRLLCLDCIRGTVLGGDGKDQQEMREFLSSKGVTVPVSATYMEVLSLFEDAESGAFDHFEEDIKGVKYPVLPTSALHVLQSDFE